MRLSIAAATIVFVAGVSVVSNDTLPVYVTEVVTAYTTYCPAPTSIVHGNQATTLTISNCPCTITKPATSVAATSTPVVPLGSSAVVAPVSSIPVYTNGTIVAPTSASSGAVVATRSATSSPIATYTGAANKAFAASGAGLAAVFGLVACAL
ncbi:mmc protein [Cryomyces antarcticus]